MAENKKLSDDEIKLQRRKRIDSKVKKRITELLTLYADVPVQEIKIYRELIEHLAFVDVSLREFKEDILERGYQVKYQNGLHQSGWKRNESVDLYDKWLSNRLSNAERLKKLLYGEERQLDDGFNEFINS